MVRSMTGFGRGTAEESGMNFTVEVKSVNSRYLEFNARVPKGYLFLEDKLKALVQSRVSRGKIEMFVTINKAEDENITVELNKSYAEAYINAVKELSETFGLENNLRATNFLGNPDIFKITKSEIDEEAAAKVALDAANAALDKFIAMREIEGEKMAEDVKNRIDTILSNVEFIDLKSPETVAAYRQRLEARIKELLEGAAFDETRVITETAIYADKIAVSEETVRLKSHIDQLLSMLNTGGAIGRKLDFIVLDAIFGIIFLFDKSDLIFKAFEGVLDILYIIARDKKEQNNTQNASKAY